MRILSAAFIAAAALTVAPAYAADIDVSSHIDAVTVYSDGAMVTRLAEVTLPQGASTLLIKGLPSVLDPASLRVEATADGTLVIGAVEARLVPGEAKPVVDAELEAKISGMREESDTVAARIDALDTKRNGVMHYGAADPGKLSGGKSVDPALWKSAWDAVGDALLQVNEELRVARARKAELAAEIATLERARPAQPRGGQPKHDVAIAVESNGELKASLSLVYRVSQAAWTPRYDAKLDTGTKDKKPSLELVRRAEISQRTGEDWQDAKLAVSTVRTQGGTAAPEVTPLIVSFNDAVVEGAFGGVAQRASVASKAAPAASVPAPMGVAGVSDAAKLEPPAPVLGKPVLASLDAGPFQATFAVPGKVSVPRDGSSKTFALSTATIQPDLIARVAPALDQTAYLDVSFVQTRRRRSCPARSRCSATASSSARAASRSLLRATRRRSASAPTTASRCTAWWCARRTPSPAGSARRAPSSRSSRRVSRTCTTRPSR
jgi:uncharacterized protein (TIGR02231 family)